MRNTETAMLSHSLLQPNAKATNEEKSTLWVLPRAVMEYLVLPDLQDWTRFIATFTSTLWHVWFNSKPHCMVEFCSKWKSFIQFFPVQLVIWLLHWLPFFNLFAILFFLSNLFAFLFVVLSCLLSWLWFYLVCLLGCYHFCSLAASSVDCKCWYATPIKVHHHIIVSITIIFSI